MAAAAKTTATSSPGPRYINGCVGPRCNISLHVTSRNHSVRLKVSSTKWLSNPTAGRRTKGPPGPGPVLPADPAGLTFGHVAREPACYIVTLQGEALAPSASDGNPRLRPQPHVVGVGRARRRTASASTWTCSQGSGVPEFRVRLRMRLTRSAQLANSK